MKNLSSVNSAQFNTTIEKLWDVLTQPDWTEKYMFNCSVISDLQKGSKIDWKGEFQGQEAYLTGEILEIDAPRKIKYTLIDPSLMDPADPNNYVHITYEIRQQGENLLLTIVNETFDGNADRMKEITEGWEAFIFPGIKACL